ncbi:hypothetical protein Rcae01_05257 [Novipirellula caenicola]|uniref:Uncharacterized protein n=1 Tax=Novipirellula caenicola TaxID=1536901 RepID=A0ABP9VX78_9BACT
MRLEGGNSIEINRGSSDGESFKQWNPRVVAEVVKTFVAIANDPKLLTAC